MRIQGKVAHGTSKLASCQSWLTWNDLSRSFCVVAGIVMRVQTFFVGEATMTFFFPPIASQVLNIALFVTVAKCHFGCKGSGCWRRGVVIRADLGTIILDGQRYARRS